MIPGGHGNDNPNVDWTRSRGFYIFYLIFLTVFHLILLCFPFIDVQMAWTLTNITHNVVRRDCFRLRHRLTYYFTGESILLARVERNSLDHPTRRQQTRDPLWTNWLWSPLDGAKEIPHNISNRSLFADLPLHEELWISLHSESHFPRLSHRAETTELSSISSLQH